MEPALKDLPALIRGGGETGRKKGPSGIPTVESHVCKRQAVVKRRAAVKRWKKVSRELRSFVRALMSNVYRNSYEIIRIRVYI